MVGELLSSPECNISRHKLFTVPALTVVGLVQVAEDNNSTGLSILVKLYHSRALEL